MKRKAHVRDDLRWIPAACAADFVARARRDSFAGQQGLAGQLTNDSFHLDKLEEVAHELPVLATVREFETPI